MNIRLNESSRAARDVLDAGPRGAASSARGTQTLIPLCPKCDVGLVIVQFKNIEVDYCHRCRGLWLDAGELETLLQQTGARTDDPLLDFQKQTGAIPAGRKHLCPRCDQALQEITVRDSLTLDRCAREQGLWFDADELKQLLTMFPREAGASRAIEYLNDLFGAMPTQ